MMTDETKPEDFVNNRKGDYSHIKGWGIDADLDNDPTYPMKNRTNEEHRGYVWPRPEQQPENIEFLKSVERPNITAVFGESAPPSGLSGAIRRMAYKYSESDMRRWVPLVMADRIGMIEGILDDLSKGIIPNIPKERGWTAEWKYNRANFAVKAAVTVGITAAVVALVLSQRKRKRKSDLAYGNQ